MTPDRWSRVQALFHDALEADEPAERLAAEPNAEIRVAAERLVAARNDAGSFIEHGALDAYGGAEAPSEHGDDRYAGERVGPWQIVRRVGRGGMGDVFLAERADGAYRQRAALKLVRRGMDSEAVLARFRQERQILAGLDHRGVARLLDGGVAEGGPFDGRPYFAMEFVEGEPITAYCDGRRLGVRERLRLWAEVGEAVAAAHRRLVVHRDLKPSNVLVAEDADGRPHAKLLDFGIAKLLTGGEAGDKIGGDGAGEPLTRTGMRVLTPAYAAPEQVRGEAVTTATDVYGLGAVLYELLAGRRPVVTAGRSPREVERAVLDTEPERPSTAASGSGGTPTSDDTTPEAVADARHTEPARLRKTLAGDLDAVCLKALRKEPAARYAGADAFVEDVKRYLEGQPVAARRGSRAYRARKFVTRHKAGLAAATLVVVSLAAGVGATLWQASEAQAERDQSEAVTEFLADILSSADPGALSGLSGEADGSVRGLLDNAADRIGTEFGSQPEVRGRLLGVIALAYQSLSAYDEAETHYDGALAAYREAGMHASPEMADVLNMLANTYRDAGKSDAARAQYEQAIAMYRAMPAVPEHELAVALSQFGSLLWFYEGDMEAAESPLRESVALFRRDPPGDLDGRNNYALVLNAYANLLHRRGDYEEADALYSESLGVWQALRNEQPGAGEQSYAITLSNYADLQRFRGRLDAAETFENEALERHRASQGERNLDVALSHAKLGRIYHEQGHHARADSFLRIALPMTAESVPEGHPYLAIMRLSTLPPRRAMGRLTEVRQAFDALRPSYETAFPEGHPALADLYAERSRIELAEGHAARALESARTGLTILEAAENAEGIRAAHLQVQLGLSLAALGDREAAEDALRKGRASFVALQGEDGAEAVRATGFLHALGES